MKSRIIRVFISSPFRDMNAERDYLNNIIFPQLREYCKHRFLHFIPIDLRWGIKEEDSRNGLVLSTCFEEIDNSRPFFIGILGSRYGSSANTNDLRHMRVKMEKHRPWIERKVFEGTSITEMEMEYGVLRNMDIPYASFFIRGDDMTIPNDYRDKSGSDSERRLKLLKSRIRNQKKYPVVEYSSIKQLGDTVKYQLIQMIEKEFPLGHNESEDAILQKQEYILERRSHVLCDMCIELQNFQEMVNNTSIKVFYIYGLAGVGTSTMLAYCCMKLRKMYSNNRILYFDLDSVNKGEKPLDAMFHFLNLDQNRLPENKWSMIAVDNASMLRDYDVNRVLVWLRGLSPNAHVVFATEQNSPLATSLSYSFACPTIKVNQYTKEQKCELICNFIGQYGKKLTDKQLEAFLNQKGANITELLLLLRALVNYGSFDCLNDYIDELTKNSFSQYAVWTLQKESIKIFSDISRLLGDKYVTALIAIAAAGTGLSEDDLLAILKITPAEWSVIRPNVLQFCKGNEEGWKLSNDNWYPNVDFYDWENVSRQMIKWFTAHPETWHYAAPIMRHIFFFIVVPPFTLETKFGPISADRPIVKDVLDELFAFVMSPDMVKQLNDMEYSSLWIHSPLLTKNMSDSPTMVYGRTVLELPVDEAISFYRRLFNTAMGLSRGGDASWCCDKISDLQKKHDVSQSIIYEAKAYMFYGKGMKAIELIKRSGLVVEHKWSLFSRKSKNPVLSYPQLCVMHQLLDCYCACGKWKEINSLLRPLLEHIEKCFTPKWNDTFEDNDMKFVSYELIAKIAFIKSGCYPQIADRQITWKMLQLSDHFWNLFQIGHPVSFFLRMSDLLLNYRSACNQELSENDKNTLYSYGKWAAISAHVCYGYGSYQYARAHLLFTYIHFKLYHDYGSAAKRLHDYVEKDEQGRVLNHSDEYFYGSLDYGRFLESNYKKDIDWNHVDKDVQKQLMCEFDFFWNIEKEIQPEWYNPLLQNKRDAYRVSIHLLDDYTPRTLADLTSQQECFHHYSQSARDFATSRLDIHKY